MVRATALSGKAGPGTTWRYSFNVNTGRLSVGVPGSAGLGDGAGCGGGSSSGGGASARNVCALGGLGSGLAGDQGGAHRGQAGAEQAAAGDVRRQ
ncbi:hypothetical protein GCM10020218_080050 [Dactylosporangium vinaceum]